MEKLIIKTRKSSATNADWENIKDSLSACDSDFKAMQELFKKYEKKYYSDYFNLEYSIELFKNMKSIDEVHNFIHNEVLKNNYVDWEAVYIPEFFKSLEPWIPSYVTDDKFKQNFLEEVKKNCLAYHSDWVAEHRNISKEVLNKADKIKF